MAFKNRVQRDMIVKKGLVTADMVIAFGELVESGLKTTRLDSVLNRATTEALELS